MGSEQSDGTSFQPSEPKLCANNCGFFGSACTENLCSKCFRDSRIEAEQAVSAKAAMEKTRPPILIKQADGNLPVVFSDPTTGSTPSPSNSGNSDKSPVPATPKRCSRSSCNKKIELMGFKCKCKRSFCTAHRFPDKHDCDFDYKTAGRNQTAMANPVIKADKIVRF